MAGGSEGNDTTYRFFTEGTDKVAGDLEKLRAALDKTGAAGSKLSGKFSGVKTAFADLDAARARALDMRNAADNLEETLEALHIPADGVAQSVKKLAGVLADVSPGALAASLAIGGVAAGFALAGAGAVALTRDARDLADQLRAFEGIEGFQSDAIDAKRIEDANVALDTLGSAFDRVKQRAASAAAGITGDFAKGVSAVTLALQGVDHPMDAVAYGLGAQAQAAERAAQKTREAADVDRDLAEQLRKEEEAHRKAEQAAREHAAEIERLSKEFDALYQRNQDGVRTLVDLSVAARDDILSDEDKINLAYAERVEAINATKDAQVSADAIERAIDEAKARRLRDIAALNTEVWKGADLSGLSTDLGAVDGQLADIAVSLEAAGQAVSAAWWAEQAQSIADSLFSIGGSITQFFAQSQAQTTDALTAEFEAYESAVWDTAKVGADGQEELSKAQRIALTKQKRATNESIMDSFRKEKAAAITTALIQGLQAEAMTLGSMPFPASLVAATAVGAEFAVIVDQIEKQEAPIIAHSGLAPDEIPATLEQGEGVLSRQGVSAIGGPDAVRAANRGQAIGMPSVIRVDHVYGHRALATQWIDASRAPGPVRDSLTRASGTKPGKSGILSPTIGNSTV